MNVCLIEPPKFVSLTHFVSTISMPPIGPAYIATVIHEAGEECIKQGAYGYLMKPIRFNDLGKIIQDALSKRWKSPELSGR